MVVKSCRGTGLGVAAAIAMFALAGCSSSQSPAEKAWNDATAACERLQATDQRQDCFTAAMQSYQAAQKTTSASTCPKGSC